MECLFNMRQKIKRYSMRDFMKDTNMRRREEKQRGRKRTTK